jgi:AmmeMemoRadiSam system radical SAM enzyme/AmmeMemoRadiSam system protein B/AmmeMemoRadiSam system protein A
LRDGDQGFCFVRENRGGEIVLTTYGRSTGFCIDPIEKKPLNHFYPGTSVLSFGTAGCNLGCRFCQNWDISKSREVKRLSERAMPADIAWTAKQHGCRSVAFTYNDPVIWAEYAMDTARECHQLGIKTVAVTAGYITEQAREPFFSMIDAANVDLKGFSEEFYHGLTASHLQPVLDTLAWLKRETDVWVEITNLIIPGANDSPDELRRMCDWLLEHVGDQTPVHFTAFHPDFRMLDRPKTPPETLATAYDIASGAGLKHVYTGNIHDVRRQSTYCHHCGTVLIERDWYRLGVYRLDGNRCAACDARIAGQFDQQPGDWGPNRRPVTIDTAPPTEKLAVSADPTADEGETGTMIFNDEQRQSLHREASRLIATAVSGMSVGEADTELAGTASRMVQGAFVTLKRGENLRACCGVLGQEMSLVNCLQRSAIQTATADTRLPTISPIELPYLSLDVSILHGFRRLPADDQQRFAEVEIGRHGLRIQGSKNSGLLLPNVATEQGWATEQFLQAVCRKAGLPPQAWRDSNNALEVFESYYFGGPLDSEVIATPDAVPSFPDLQMRQLAEHCCSNIKHHLAGSTPSYYLLDAPDGDVQGISLQVTWLSGPAAQTVHEQLQISWRPGIPLQSTLLEMTKNLAELLRRQGATVDSANLAVNLTVFTDPAMHGTTANPDLRGLDPNRRAIVLVAGRRTVWSWDRHSDADSLLAGAHRLLGGSEAQIYSVTGNTVDDRSDGSSFPSLQQQTRVRPAAVAGTFYPREADELKSLVRGMIQATTDAVQPKRNWAAAMVPHAGLVYSGQVAAEVLSRLDFPETIVIIGPKHTRDGVDWAIAPNEQWQIPGQTLAADREMAVALSKAVDGFQLDDAAHRNEHAIEVELPFLAQLAPNSKIVGIVMGSGNWQRCRDAARQLAAFLKTMPTPPLLLVSSDMNHFLDDAETRRRDALALGKMRDFDSQGLLETVQENAITMCGIFPAVLVMETVRAMYADVVTEQVAYATSADVSGDLNRVVGYAGMLLGSGR